MATDIDGMARHFEHLLRQDLNRVEDLIHRVERTRGEPEAAARLTRLMTDAQGALGSAADRWMLLAPSVSAKCPLEAALDGDEAALAAARQRLQR